MRGPLLPHGLRCLRRLGVLCAIFLIASCASKTDIKEQNSLVMSAQTLERRAAQAYALGDLQGAAATYESAALVYESLALAEPLARARLSAARAVAEAGKSDQALQIVAAVLAQPQAISPGTQIVAQGRAAALYLAQGGAAALTSASAHWQQASALCAPSCAERAALWVLRARIDLAQGNAAAALQNANAALTAVDRQAAPAEQANALRARAQAYAALNQPAQTLVDASAALALDQEVGNTGRVQADLQLLAKAHEALGNAEQAARFAALAQRALAASRSLQSGAP
jgi:tetratricopeptide (TPR) repeat protein